MPSLIDNYILERKVGEGTSGEVFKGILYNMLFIIRLNTRERFSDPSPPFNLHVLFCIVAG